MYYVLVGDEVVIQDAIVTEMARAGRVCIIGAGPSGMSVLCWLAKLGRAGNRNDKQHRKSHLSLDF